VSTTGISPKKELCKGRKAQRKISADEDVVLLIRLLFRFFSKFERNWQTHSLELQGF